MQNMLSDPKAALIQEQAEKLGLHTEVRFRHNRTGIAVADWQEFEALAEKAEKMHLHLLAGIFYRRASMGVNGHANTERLNAKARKAEAKA